MYLGMYSPKTAFVTIFLTMFVMVFVTFAVAKCVQAQCMYDYSETDEEIIRESGVVVKLVTKPTFHYIELQTLSRDNYVLAYIPINSREIITNEAYDILYNSLATKQEIILTLTCCSDLKTISYGHYAKKIVFVTNR